MTQTRGRVLVICHSNYEEDARVRRESEALRDAGWEVDALGLREPGRAAQEVVAGIRLTRLPVEHRQGRGIGGYLAEYAQFFVRAFVAAASMHRRRRYRLAIVHTLPDALVFATLPLRLVGVPVLLDLHEAMPVFFGSRFPGKAGVLAIGVLSLVERAAIRYASAAVTVNDALRDRLVHDGINPDRISTIINAPDVSHFERPDLAPRDFMADGRLRLVYAGSLTPLYEVSVIVDAVASLAAGVDGPAIDVTFDIYGRGDSEVELAAQIARLGLQDRVRLHGRIPFDAIPEAIAGADLGVAPTRRDAYTDLSMSTKLFEYLALRRPVLASRLRTVERYFGDEGIAFYTPGDSGDAASVIRRFAAEPDFRARILTSSLERAATLTWDQERARYLAIVDDLTAR